MDALHGQCDVETPQLCTPSSTIMTSSHLPAEAETEAAFAAVDAQPGFAASTSVSSSSSSPSLLSSPTAAATSVNLVLGGFLGKVGHRGNASSAEVDPEPEKVERVGRWQKAWRSSWKRKPWNR